MYLSTCLNACRLFHINPFIFLTAGETQVLVVIPLRSAFLTVNAGLPVPFYRSCQMIGAEWRVPRDAKHVVSAATRRQRQMAWVPAVGMSVIPQRERKGRGRSDRSEEEKGGFELWLV
ncbi:hypothetical protein ILYODFUR_015589 [Ilyodon furcidens]|uniref:Uncharacterized protein n=1 Tax=Ilyodon furcidens TaxID=33524 RepID=A0ABV0UTG4_9TELE